MNRHKQQDEKCECAACNGLDVKAWEEDMMEENGWFIHMVGSEDPETETGFNAHTHGLEKTFNHLNLQIIVPLPQDCIGNIFSGIVKKIKSGTVFEIGKNYDEIIKGYLIKIVQTKECNRDVLRVILPDPNGNLEFDEIDDKYKSQYEKTKWAIDND